MLAYEDTALPIRHGQTISQPTVVARCLEWLAVEPGMRVLDVGSGSGYTTALLSHLVLDKSDLSKREGEVIGVEIIPELVAFGQENLAKLAPRNAHIERAGEDLGKPSDAPFDRILVSAATNAVPPGLVRQLKEGGRMVIPIRDAICVVDDGARPKMVCHEGYAFVPLIT